ncbi:MAG TPA: glycerophosphodiester phosphodiesterase family protein [Kofleriaceae bacterium]
MIGRFVPHLGRLGRATRWRRGKGAPPRVWAHRGDSAHAPENTLAAFDLAVRAGADGIELDVQLDRDGKVAVFHDDTLDRLCGRPGRIGDVSVAELRVGGEPVPLLADVLASIALEVNVELKVAHAGRAAALVAATAAVIKASPRPDRILISSFDPIALVQMHPHLPDAALAFLFGDDQALPVRRGWVGTAIGASLVHPQHTLCTEARVDAWHRAGLPVNVWTVDDPVELRRLSALGVDGVFANDPAHARVAL